LAKLNYGKWFLPPSKQERAFLQGFIDHGLPSSIDLEKINLLDSESKAVFLTKLN